jgi:hypothetical protein
LTLDLRNEKKIDTIKKEISLSPPSFGILFGLYLLLLEG